MWFKKKTESVTPAGPCSPAKPFFNYYTGECVATEEEVKPRGVEPKPVKKAPAKKAPAKKAPAKKAPAKKAPKK